MLTTMLFLAAIAAGSVIGVFGPGCAVAGLADPLILLLVGAVFFTMRIESPSALRRAPRTALIAIALNFVAIPLIAAPLTLLLPSEALRVGVLIYCLAPCTDWFLGFTRLAGGDVAAAGALVPLQMILQLALLPVWLGLFAGESVGWMPQTAATALLVWFALPAGIGLAARLLVPRSWRVRAIGVVDAGVPVLIALVIVAIFAGNVTTILADPASFAWALVVVFAFLVATFALGDATARALRLDHAAHALVTVTTSARNAPLMLAVTTVALPDQPVVQAAIVLGMLIEFPHLTAITHILRRRIERRPGTHRRMAAQSLSRR